MHAQISADRPPQHFVTSKNFDVTAGSWREFLGNRFVYILASPRARGLSVGIDMNPDRRCNFDCQYCDVERGAPVFETALDVAVMAEELARSLEFVLSGALCELPAYHHMPKEIFRLRQVALSGNGEPTLCPNFLEAVQTVVHIRARRRFPFFKMVLQTNSSGLDLRQVQEGLKLFTAQDEIWAKLEAGTQDYMNKVNRPRVSLDKILENILLTARQRPVIIQSLFPTLDQKEPPAEEIEQFALRLDDLRRAGAQIPLVQIYSASRPTAHSNCGHLPLKTLSAIAQRVQEISQLKTEVF